MSAGGCHDPAMALNDPIVMAEYDPHWPEIFSAEAAAIHAALGAHLRAIHHVGSTAVRGMPAKPVIDMLAESCGPVDCSHLDGVLTARGFSNHGEFGVPGRVFYRRDAAPVLHLHVFPAGHPSVRRDLGFRDKLRADERLRVAYAAMKCQLAEAFRHDRPSYSRGKESFILDAAGPRPASRPG